MNAAPCSWRVVMWRTAVLAAERLEDVHRLLAGHREDVLAALGREALDEQGGGRSGGAGGHGRSLRDGPLARRPGRDILGMPDRRLARSCGLPRSPPTRAGGNPAGVWIGEALPADAEMQRDRGRGRLLGDGVPCSGRLGRRPGGSASATSARWPRSRSAATRRSPAAWRSPSAGWRRRPRRDGEPVADRR